MCGGGVKEVKGEKERQKDTHTQKVKKITNCNVCFEERNKIP